MRLIMDNSYTVVEFGSEPEYIQTKIKNNLRESLGVREDGYMYAKAYQLGYWDGVTEMTEYDKKTDTFRFPTGLIDLADEALGKLQETISFEYEIIDNRPDPLLTSLDLPESIKLEDGKTLRDYQYEAVKNTLEERYGIIKLATNSGKTLTAAGLIKESLPHLEKGETITFFTHSKELFRQSHKALEEALDVKVGKVGSGTFKPEVVNVAMVPTIASKLNIDVEKGVSFTPKQMVTKKMATILLPQFDRGINQLVGLRAYVQNMTVKTKADQQFKDEIIKLIEKSESDAKALFNLRQYNVRYQDILKKKNAEKFKEKKQYTDFLNSSVVVFGDECLVADTLIEKADGTFAPINTFKVGDEIKGGTILDVIERETETIILEHEQGHLEGSITHPTFSVKREDLVKGESEPKVELLARVPQGDYVLSTKPTNNKMKVTYDNKEYYLSEVTSHRAGSKQKVYDFTTTSGTFIANNTLTHNCHRIKGDGYYNVMMSAENALIKVGLTGTIDETDKLLVQRAKAAFHNISAVTTNKEMIARGVSADVDVMLVPVQSVVHNGKEVRLKEKEIYQETYKNGIVHNEYRNALAAKITEVWYNKGETILLIVNQIEHGEIMSEYLESLNIPHQYIHGSISDEEREEALQKVRDGENRVLISSTILDEGVDISNLSVLVNMAAGKSLRQVLQRVGRILRIKEDGRKATVIDFVDSTHTHLLAHGKRRRKIYEEEEFPVTYLGETK